MLTFRTLFSLLLIALSSLNNFACAEDISARGWRFLRQGNNSDAMRRFNQAWLIDYKNGSALWGIGVISSINKRSEDSLKLFAEAEGFVGADIDFAVDYTLTLGSIAAKDGNQVLLQEAFTRFARVHERARQHTLNLQSWAITLVNVGNYAEAWKKIQLAEATPRRADLDKRFIAALQAKMPRP